MIINFSANPLIMRRVTMSEKVKLNKVSELEKRKKAIGILETWLREHGESDNYISYCKERKSR